MVELNLITYFSLFFDGPTSQEGQMRSGKLMIPPVAFHRPDVFGAQRP